MRRLKKTKTATRRYSDSTEKLERWTFLRRTQQKGVFVNCEYDENHETMKDKRMTEEEFTSTIKAYDCVFELCKTENCEIIAYWYNLRGIPQTLAVWYKADLDVRTMTIKDRRRKYVKPADWRAGMVTCYKVVPETDADGKVYDMAFCYTGTHFNEVGEFSDWVNTQVATIKRLCKEIKKEEIRHTEFTL